jgi:hypothetical protein
MYVPSKLLLPMVAWRAWVLAGVGICSLSLEICVVVPVAQRQLRDQVYVPINTLLLMVAPEDFGGWRLGHQRPQP